jgi:hypothetical protein
MPKSPLSPFLLDRTSDAMPAEERGTGRAGPPRSAMDLDGGELFVVAALRAWVAPLTRPGEPHPEWRDLFRIAGVGVPGTVAFEALMSVIGSQAIRLIDVHCCSCRALGDDETAMLRLVAALQSGDAPGALAVLRGWLPEDAALPALNAARRFAAAMAEAGLVLQSKGRVIAFPLGRTLH